MIDADAPDPRYTTILEGVVHDNKDPDGLGRVRVRVPGVVDDGESAWAWPAATGGGGSPQRGHWHVPDIGAEVYVFFIGGDPDKPRFFSGHWGVRQGESETPTDVKAAFNEDGPEGAPGLKSWETDRFALTFDDRDGRSRCYVYAKAQGQELIDGTALMLEFDDVQGTIAISAPSGLILRSMGVIDIDALMINIGGRKVLKVDRPI